MCRARIVVALILPERFLYIGRCLIDRRDDGAGGGIRFLPYMNCVGCESHAWPPNCLGETCSMPCLYPDHGALRQSLDTETRKTRLQPAYCRVLPPATDRGANSGCANLCAGVRVTDTVGIPNPGSKITFRSAQEPNHAMPAGIAQTMCSNVAGLRRSPDLPDPKS